MCAAKLKCLIGGGALVEANTTNCSLAEKLVFLQVRIIFCSVSIRCSCKKKKKKKKKKRKMAREKSMEKQTPLKTRQTNTPTFESLIRKSNTMKLMNDSNLFLLREEKSVMSGGLVTRKT